MYSLAHEFGEPDIQVIMDLPIDVYRGWVVWFDKRRKESERQRRA